MQPRDFRSDLDGSPRRAALSPDRTAGRGDAAHSGPVLLRRFIVAIGLGWAVAFVIIGVAYRLQLYGDGAIFSYAVAVESSWDFHWRNIAVRLFVHVFSHIPAEAYVAATGDAQGGVALYGGLFFSAPLIGLILTAMADRSPGRRLFAGACLSTALQGPLVFGCPTELWFAHALFWPTLALCHYAPATPMGIASVFIAFIALALTHEGGLVFAVVIVATVAVRGVRSHLFTRACIALALTAAVWAAIKLACPPDDYFAPVLARAGRYILDPANFSRPISMLIAAALALYVAAYSVLRKLNTGRPAVSATLLVVAALAAYWGWLDQSVHAEDRYTVRTVLIVATPLLGVSALMTALAAESRLSGRTALIDWIEKRVAAVPAYPSIGVLLVVTLIHGVETAKYVAAWTRYASAVRALSTGTASDPALGDDRFVSSERIRRDLGRLRWNSTTPYLSVMVAPGLRPLRLVIDPSANYIWLTCTTAAASEAASRAIPMQSRALVRAHACFHPRTWTSPAS